MDSRAQQIYRNARANPGDERSQRQWERAVQRMFTDPDDRFQEDLRHKTGRLWKALAWEMEFSRISVNCRSQGGQLICRFLLGRKPTHIRIWYPSFGEILSHGLTEDIRITVASSPNTLGDVLESLEDNFPGATVVSAAVAREQPDGWKVYGDTQKPQRRRDMDPASLVVDVPVDVTRGRVAGVSSWVA